MARHNHICGCYYLLPAANYYSTARRVYLPQVSLKAHTTILETTSRTLLTQTFTNPSKTKGIKEIRYTFPLYDGVSVVGFTCHIGDRTIVGEVKEKEKARAVYEEAVAKGETAGLLEQLPEASDVFTTTIGNVPPGATVLVDITYLGELKHDAEVDGVRFTIPSTVAPRYGSYPGDLADGYKTTTSGKGFEVTVDAVLSHGSFIQQIRSPSHPIAVSLGTTSVEPQADPQSNQASATLSLSSAELDKDFIIQVVAKDIGNPKAILEAHPTIPGQRALMATLVPKFALPAERPEIVFVCDRSGSMSGSNIQSLREALKVFLKSLPIGVKFNICSFGSHYSFLWSKSKSYSQASLKEAMEHVEKFDANFGGTSMYAPMEATMKQRYKDMNLEIFLVTDGEIWDQQQLFNLLNTEIGEKKAPIRVFTLGIGDAFSSSLVEGVARAGNGFSQAVGSTENCAAKVVRMLKGALSPHVTDYTLEVKYGGRENDDFEIIEKVTDSLKVKLTLSNDETTNKVSRRKSLGKLGDLIKKPISLFNTSANTDVEIDPKPVNDDDGQARYAHLPAMDTPKLLQAPHTIPPLFSFSRASVYLLMSPETTQKTPTSVILRGTSTHGPLELEIPVDVLEQPGETIHQLAAKKAIADLEEGRGWLIDCKDSRGVLVKETYPGRFDEMVEREAVRLGVEFQVGGKFCSFVAVEKKSSSTSKDKEGDEKMAESDNDWKCLDDVMDGKTLSGESSQEESFSYDERGSQSATKSKSRSNLLSSVGSAMSAFRSPESSRMRRIARKSSGAPPPPPPPSAPAPRMSLRSLGAPLAPQAESCSASRTESYLAPHMRGAPGGGLQKAAYDPSLYASLSSAPPPMASMSNSVSTTAAPAPKMRMARANGGVVGGSGGRDRGGGDGGFGMRSRSGQVATVPSRRSSHNAYRFEAAVCKTEIASVSDYSGLECDDDFSDENVGFGLSDGAPPEKSKMMKKKSIAPNRKAGANVEIEGSSLPSDPLHALIALQDFEGYWLLSKSLCQVLGLAMAKVQAQVAKSKVDRKVFATVLAVRFFERKLSGDKDTWELVVEKARGWLEMQGIDEGSELWTVEGLAN